LANEHCIRYYLKFHQNKSELDKQTLINNSRPKTNLQNFSFLFSV
jgi:hypothetical protein